MKASGRRKRGLLEGKLPKEEGLRPRQPEGSRPPSLLLLLRARGPEEAGRNHHSRL